MSLTAASHMSITNMDRHWDEDKVGDWLKRINCAQYVDLFKRMSPSPSC